MSLSWPSCLRDPSLPTHFFSSSIFLASATSLSFCPFSVLSPSFCPRGVRWCLSLLILVFLFRFAVLPQFSFLLGISLFLPSFLLPSPTFLSESQTLPLPETPCLCYVTTHNLVEEKNLAGAPLQKWLSFSGRQRGQRAPQGVEVGQGGRRTDCSGTCDTLAGRPVLRLESVNPTQ